MDYIGCYGLFSSIRGVFNISENISADIHHILQLHSHTICGLFFASKYNNSIYSIYPTDGASYFLEAATVFLFIWNEVEDAHGRFLTVFPSLVYFIDQHSDFVNVKSLALTKA